MFLLLFLTIFSSKILLSQSIDSLDKKLIFQYEDLTIQAMRSAQWKQAITYTDTAYTLSKNKNFNDGIAMALTLKGECYMHQGNASKAYQTYAENLLFMENCAYQGYVKGRLYKDLFIFFSAQGKQDSIQKYKDIIFNLPCDKSSLLAKDYVAKQLLMSNKPQESIFWVNKNIACATALNTKVVLLGYLSFKSNIYQSLEDYETALLYVDSTLQMAQAFHDSLYICLAYDQLGVINTRLENYFKALSWFAKGVQLSEQLYKKNKIYSHSKLVKTAIPIQAFYAHLASGYQNLAYKNEVYLDSAHFYYQKVLQIHYQKKDYANVALQLVNLAKIENLSGKNYEAALDSLQKAYKIAPRETNWSSMQYHIYSTMGEAYTKKEQFKMAKLYLDSAETVSHILSDTINRLMTVYNLKNALYLAQENYKKAYTYEKKETVLYLSLIHI